MYLLQRIQLYDKIEIDRAVKTASMNHFHENGSEIVKPFLNNIIL